jgi:hypothetical protein
MQREPRHPIPMRARSAQTVPPLGPAGEHLSIRSLVARYRGLSLVVAGLLVVLLAMFVAALLHSGPTAVSDATTCAQWSSATQGQQDAYAGLYQREHGPVPGRTAGAASVVAAINSGCMQAFANDVEDNVNVVQAIRQ